LRETEPSIANKISRGKFSATFLLASLKDAKAHSTRRLSKGIFCTVVEQALALLRLALERGWTVGLFFLLFCGGALAAVRFGVKLPPSLTEWASAGLIFGAAVIGLSWVANAVRYIGQKLRTSAHQKAEAAEQAADARSVLQNLSAMSIDDAAELYRILCSDAPRFQIATYAPAHRLLELRLIRAVTMIDLGFVCELHPAIAARKDELKSHLADQLRRVGA
jgi:hypothetical protein